MQTSKIKVESGLRFSNIINELETGRLKIPRFQRDFVWERTKVIHLLDSIYNEFPIGSFFIWAADQRYSGFFRDIAELDLPGPSAGGTLDFILDGQQRITSLYVAIKGMKIGKEDYSQIAFDLDRQTFVLAKKTYEAGSPVVPFCNFFNNEFIVFGSLSESRQKIFDKARSIFINYPLSVVRVYEKNLYDAIEIFERINQGGKKLSIFDLVVAGTWSPNFDLRKKFESLRGELENKGFGRIKPEVVLHVMGLVIKGYCNKINLLAINREEAEETWDRVRDSVSLAVSHLSEGLGVKSYDFVPYPAIISLLAYYFYKSTKKSPDSEETEVIRQWFWQSSLGERYARSRETLMGEDRKRIFDRLLRGDKLTVGFPINITEDRLARIKMSTKSAIKSAFLCLMAQKKPKHFDNGIEIKLDQNAYSRFVAPEKHHFFPKAYLKRNKVKNDDSMLNFCFIPAELNKIIRDNPPSQYLDDFKNKDVLKDALKTHLIPIGEFLEKDDYQEFVDVRANLVKEEFERLAGSRILISDEPNKAIMVFENNLRDYLDISLEDAFGEDYWLKQIPDPVREGTKERVELFLRKNPTVPGASISNRDLFDHMNVLDYLKIIKSNWVIFENSFRSKSETEKRFLNFNEYRNTIAHNKKLDSVTKKEGEAAIEWLYRIIKDGLLDDQAEDAGLETANLLSKEELVLIDGYREWLGKECNAELLDRRKDHDVFDFSIKQGEYEESWYDLTRSDRYIPGIMIDKCSYFSGKPETYLCLHLEKERYSDVLLEIIKFESMYEWQYKPEIGTWFIMLPIDLRDMDKTRRELKNTYDAVKKIETRYLDKKEDVFSCNSEGISAKGKLLPGNEFLVFAGSTASAQEASSFQGTNGQKMRRELLEEGKMIREGSVLRFTDNYYFGSPSSASSVVLGSSSNGWLKWVDTNGNALGGVKKKMDEGKLSKTKRLLLKKEKFLELISREVKGIPTKELDSLLEEFGKIGWVDYGQEIDNLSCKQYYVDHQITTMSIRADGRITFFFDHLVKDRGVESNIVEEFRKRIYSVFSGQPEKMGSKNREEFDCGELVRNDKFADFYVTVIRFAKSISNSGEKQIK